MCYTSILALFLSIYTDMLSTSLSTLKAANNNARSVKLKLTDKMTPCLTVEIELVPTISIYLSNRITPSC